MRQRERERVLARTAAQEREVAEPEPPAAAPAESLAGRILDVQRSAGNRTVNRMIQRKLLVSPAGDRYEQEADAVADRIAGPSRGLPDERGAGPAPEVGADGGEVPSGFASQLAAGGGSGLDPATRGRMELAFGVDLGGVRVRENSEAAGRIGAAAFTHGSDIHFAPGQHAPGTPAGEHLLAHELTHVVQQRGATQRAPVRRKGGADKKQARAAKKQRKAKRKASKKSQEQLQGQLHTMQQTPRSDAELKRIQRDFQVWLDREKELVADRKAAGDTEEEAAAAAAKVWDQAPAELQALRPPHYTEGERVALDIGQLRNQLGAEATQDLSNRQAKFEEQGFDPYGAALAAQAEVVREQKAADAEEAHGSEAHVGRMKHVDTVGAPVGLGGKSAGGATSLNKVIHKGATGDTGKGAAKRGMDSSITASSVSIFTNVKNIFGDMFKAWRDISKAKKDKGADHDQVAAAINSVIGVFKNAGAAAKDAVNIATQAKIYEKTHALVDQGKNFGTAGKEAKQGVMGSQLGSATPGLTIAVNVLKLTQAIVAAVPLVERSVLNTRHYNEAERKSEEALLLALGRTGSRNAQMVEKKFFEMADAIVNIGAGIADLGAPGAGRVASLAQSAISAAHGIGHTVADYSMAWYAKRSRERWQGGREHGGAEAALRHDASYSVDTLITKAIDGHEGALEVVASYGFAGITPEDVKSQVSVIHAEMMKRLELSDDPKSLWDDMKSGIQAALSVPGNVRGGHRDAKRLREVRNKLGESSAFGHSDPHTKKSKGNRKNRGAFYMLKRILGGRDKLDASFVKTREHLVSLMHGDDHDLADMGFPGGKAEVKALYMKTFTEEQQQMMAGNANALGGAQDAVDGEAAVGGAAATGKASKQADVEGPLVVPNNVARQVALCRSQESEEDRLQALRDLRATFQMDTSEWKYVHRNIQAELATGESGGRKRRRFSRK